MFQDGLFSTAVAQVHPLVFMNAVGTSSHAVQLVTAGGAIAVIATYPRDP